MELALRTLCLGVLLGPGTGAHVVVDGVVAAPDLDRLAENNEATFEIRDILTAAKGAFRVLGWLGQGTAWALKFGAATVGFYAAIKALAPHWLANILPK